MFTPGLNAGFIEADPVQDVIQDLKLNLNLKEDLEQDQDLTEGGAAKSSSSIDPDDFDAVVGSIEDVIADDEFQQLQRSFVEKYYLEFDDCDENRLSYTPIFNEYVELLEKHLEQQLTERIPGFNMNHFTQLLMQRKDEILVEIFNFLLTFTDFVTFKKMFLDFRAEKEGRGLDLSHCIVVRSVAPPEATDSMNTRRRHAHITALF